VLLAKGISGVLLELKIHDFLIYEDSV